MESRLAQVVTKAQAAEKQFDQTLADTGAPVERAIVSLQQYRLAADDVIACDFLRARSTDVEARLWGAHSRLNARLRKQLFKLRKERGSKPVEARKFTKLYLEFLKDSQRFYREYIQKLNARFGAVAELQRIAGQLKSEPADSSPQTPVSPEEQAQVILSCHQILIYLGDLFRYRAAERLDKTPDWGPAIGYYALAASLRPYSGLAFHQQSVVAFEQGDYLRSTYYLYRAIVVQEPHPNAIANLELQFKKISTAWEKGDLVPKNLPHDRTASRKALVAWFIRFHSMCYKGNHFSQYEELEKEVLSRAASEIKNKTLDGVLSKMLFINFAAQDTAATKFQNEPDRREYMQSYFFFLRLNVKFFSTLLESFRRSLEKQLESGQGPSTEKRLAHNITDQVRHILPCLRLYSTWLLSNAHFLTAGLGDEVLQNAVAQLWSTYVAALSTIATAFPFRELPEVGYQLEEDVDAFAFKPLDSERTQKLWYIQGSTELKPKFSDPDLCRLDVDTEMLARVRELLVDALPLAADQDVPITFDGTLFVVQQVVTSPVLAVAPQEEIVDSHSELIQPSQAVPQHETVPSAVVPLARDIAPTQPRTLTREGTREAQLKNMVDDLVGTEDDDDDDDDLPPTPPVQRTGSASLATAEKGGYSGHTFRSGSFAKSTSPRAIPPIRTPDLHHTAESWHSNSPLGRSSQRLPSVPSIWNDSLPRNISPLTPKANATFGTPRLPSNASSQLVNGHSRVSSSASLMGSLPKQDGWSSFDPTPQTISQANGRYDHRLPSLQGPGVTGQYAGMQSPLLFGAGGGPWSTGPRKSLPNSTPPNGQGG